MAKVTQQDIEDAGFRSEQFGQPGRDWEAYVERLIVRATLWAQGRFGAGYAAVPADTPTHERLRSAELCWVSGHLWKRRAGFIDSNAVSSREGLAYLDRREYEASATRAFECAEDNMALAIGGEQATPASGAVLTSIETGPYARAPAFGVHA